MNVKQLAQQDVNATSPEGPELLPVPARSRRVRGEGNKSGNLIKRNPIILTIK